MKTIIRKVSDRWIEHAMTMQGAAIAFFGTLSLGPFLLIIEAVASPWLGTQAIQEKIVGGIGKVAGSAPAALIQQMLSNPSKHAGIAGAIGLVILIFGATNLFVSIRTAFDTIWIPKSRPPGWIHFFQEHMLSFFLLLATGLLLTIFLGMTAGISIFGNFLTQQYGLPVWIFWDLNFLLPFTIVFVLFGALYRYLPSVRLSWRCIGKGAVISAILFIVGEYILSIVFTRGLLPASYGAAEGFVALLTWIYYSVEIFLFGAEIVAVLDEG